MSLVHDRHDTEIYHCSDPDCNAEIEVHSVYEGDTGQSYFTDASIDAIDRGCPECGKPFKEAK